MAKLFIGNIPHASTEEQLVEWVTANGFDAESAQIIRDRSTGQSRGFAFIELKEQFKLEDAIKALDGQRLGGRVLTVNVATAPNSSSQKPGHPKYANDHRTRADSGSANSAA